MMEKRTIMLGMLVALPLAIYLLVGCYAMWKMGVVPWVWWLLPVCWLFTWLVARLWRPSNDHTPQALVPARHWTPRDRQAAEIVRRHQQQVDNLSMQELTSLQFYFQEIKALSWELARHYHPQAQDPFGSLTAPEILAAMRLAIDDMEQWLLTSAPGSRLLTVKQWRSLQHAPKWMRRVQNTAWAASVLINPANIARYWSSKMTIDPVTEQLQTEVLVLIYLRVIRQAGFYLIEMNSGRLRGGADAYRRAFSSPSCHVSPDVEPNSKSSSADTRPVVVTIALVGQVSSGKSSLINMLTGSRQAAVDILPETRNVQRYQLDLGSTRDGITLLDTPGFGEAGASSSQLEQIQAALRESHAVLLVMDAHTPAREADRQTLRQLEKWYHSKPRLKPPPILGILSHVDLLPPVLKWNPPYDWRAPASPKAQHIHDAVVYASEVFGDSLAAIVPVCTAAEVDRRWGVVEELVPALTLVLDEARAAALLTALEKELDRDRFRILLKQIGHAGSDLLRIWIEERLKVTQDG